MKATSAVYVALLLLVAGGCVAQDVEDLDELLEELVAVEEPEGSGAAEPQEPEGSGAAESLDPLEPLGVVGAAPPAAKESRLAVGAAAAPLVKDSRVAAKTTLRRRYPANVIGYNRYYPGYSPEYYYPSYYPPYPSNYYPTPNYPPPAPPVSYPTSSYYPTGYPAPAPAPAPVYYPPYDYYPYGSGVNEYSARHERA